MPDMDPHGAGPSIRTLLTGQDEHRSSLLWDAHLEGEVCTCSIYVVERGKRGRNIFCVSWEDRQPL